MKKHPQSKAPSECIGLVGIGLMGSAIAQQLLANGFRVLAFDVLPERSAAAQTLGCGAAAGPQEIAASCRRILLSLYDSARWSSSGR